MQHQQPGKGITRAHSSLQEREATKRRNACTTAEVKDKLLKLYDDVFAHEGYGQIQVDMRILRRGQKEVILRCGKEYRYVVDFPGQSLQHEQDASGRTRKEVIAPGR